MRTLVVRDRRGIRPDPHIAARRRKRRARAGFSLIELMVVIMLVAILAVIATPAMRTARDDRLAFDYARQYSGIIHRASVRAMARGSAHLVVINSAPRGNIRLFEAVDATLPPLGPKQVSSCKVPNQWDGVEGWTPPAASPPRSPVVDGMTLDTLGVNVDMNVGSVIRVLGGEVPTLVLCYTPGGNVYMGSGASPSGAIAAMQVAQPFTRTAEVRIMRRDAANNPRGLTRNVIIGGASDPVALGTP